jgi:DNA-binding CsgD family transcriptional regulator
LARPSIRLLERVADIEATIARISSDETEPLGAIVDAVRQGIAADRVVLFAPGIYGSHHSTAILVESRRREGARRKLHLWLAAHEKARHIARNRTHASALPAVDLPDELGLTMREQVHLLLERRGATLGWLCALRRTPFPADAAILLNRLVPSLRRRLWIEHRLRSFETVEAALETALNAIERPAFIVDATGTVVRTNAAAGSPMLLDASATRVPIGDGNFLVMLRDEGSAPLARASNAARRWRLTARQSQVLRLVCEGASNRAIAATLAIAERTVETHVTAILARVGLETRSALIARVHQD